MIYHHAVAKRPHIAYAMSWRPTVLDITNSAGGAGINRLTIAVCERDIYTIVAGERKSKPPLGYGASPAQGICHQQMQSMLVDGYKPIFRVGNIKNLTL